MLMVIWQPWGWRGKVHSSSADASGIGLIWPRPGQQKTIWACSTAPGVCSHNFCHFPPTHYYAHNNMHVSCIICYTWQWALSCSNTQFILKWIRQCTYSYCWFHSAIYFRKQNGSAWIGKKMCQCSKPAGCRARACIIWGHKLRATVCNFRVQISSLIIQSQSMSHLLAELVHVNLL